MGVRTERVLVALEPVDHQEGVEVDAEGGKGTGDHEAAGGLRADEHGAEHGAGLHHGGHHLHGWLQGSSVVHCGGEHLH